MDTAFPSSSFLLHCASCNAKGVLGTRNDDGSIQLLSCSCTGTETSTSWGVCLLCQQMERPIQRKRLKDGRSVRRHQGLHKEAPLPIMEARVDDSSSLPLDDEDTEQHDTAPSSVAMWPGVEDIAPWATEALFNSSMPCHLEEMTIPKPPRSSLAMVVQMMVPWPRVPPTLSPAAS
jgi:hypothetical protein